MTTYSVYIEKLWEDGKRCFDDLSFDEQACLAGLLMQESDSPENYLDTNRLLNVASILSKVMETYDQGYNREHIENLQASIASELAKGAISVAKHTIETLFAEMHCYPHDKGDREPTDDEYQAYSRRHAA